MAGRMTSRRRLYGLILAIVTVALMCDALWLFARALPAIPAIPASPTLSTPAYKTETQPQISIREGEREYAINTALAVAGITALFGAVACLAVFTLRSE
jgi:hypothetical protein